MNSDLKEKWLKALRSGKYTQTTQVLIDGNKDEPANHCCLGVLCEVALIPKTSYVAYNKFDLGPGAEDFQTKFEKLFELPNAQSTRLAAMNDEGKTFAEIANWIEANVKITDGKDESLHVRQG